MTSVPHRARGSDVLDLLIPNFTMFMLVGIVLIVGLSQFHRTAGAALGAVFWAVVAVVGHEAYARGHRLGLGKVEFSEGLFLSLCAGFALMNIAIAWTAHRRRRPARRLDADDLD
jgi:hypothetical protein